MDREQHLLQLLKREYARVLPWLCTKTRANVRVVSNGRGNDFSLIATWEGGEYRQFYNAASAHTLGGRGGCAAKMAESFIATVLKMRQL
jgi:hypothetical protein